MKTELSERERKLKQLNLSLDEMDQMVVDGILTRKELTDIVLRRHILAMKQVMRYAEKNLVQ